MKKTQLIELLRNIKKNIVSFVAIMMFVTLGICLYCGISWTGTAIKKGVNDLEKSCNCHDLEILFPYGMSEDDLEQLRNVDGVDSIEGSYMAYEEMEKGGKKYEVKLLQLTDDIDVPYDVVGNLPEKSGEIALSAYWAEQVGYKIGDTITFNADDDGNSRLLSKLLAFNADTDDPEELTNDTESPCGMAYLNTDTYTITALLEYPFYIGTDENGNGVSSSSILLNAVMYTAEDSFDTDAFGGYPRITIRSNALEDLSLFSDAYKTAVQELKDRVDSAACDIAEEKCALIHEDVDKIDQSVSEKLDDALKKIQDADVQIADGEQKLADAKEELDEAEKQLTDGDKQIKEAEAKLSDGKQQLDDAAATLEEKQAEIDSGWEQVRSGQAELSEKEAELASGQEQFAESEEMLNTADSIYSTVSAAVADFEAKLDSSGIQPEAIRQAWIDSGIMDAFNDLCQKYPEETKDIVPVMERINQFVLNEEWNNVRTTVDETLALFGSILSEKRGELETARQTIADGSAQIETAKVQLSEAITQLEDGQTQLSAGRETYEAKLEEYNSGVQTIADKKKELEDGRTKYNDGEKQYEEKVQELEENKEKLADGKKEYEAGVEKHKSFLENTKQLKDYGCSISTGVHGYGVRIVSVASNMLKKMRLVLASLFIIVGLLVCYSAVSRIINDQIIMIGTKKALGLMRREITLYYLSYTGVAVILGCIFGILVGVFIVEPIIIGAVSSTMLVDECPAVITAPEAIEMCLFHIVMIALVSYFACRSILRKSAVRLLQGPEPPKGRQRFYEKLGLWKRLPLFTKTIINNCFNDHRRVIGTLIGITGCTALIVTALTLRFNVLDSFTENFRNITKYDKIVYFDSSDENAEENVKAALDQAGAVSTEVYSSKLVQELPDKKYVILDLLVPSDTENFREMYQIRSLDDSTAEEYEGLWLSEAYYNIYAEEYGNTINVTDVSGNTDTIEADGYFEFHLGVQVAIMSQDKFAEIYGENAKANAFLVDTTGCDYDKLSETLLNTEGYAATTDYYKTSKLMFDTFSNISSTMVAVFVVLSVVMGILVNLNLLTMFVQEKKKELIILMINGYSLKDARRYIYSDTILLTVIGILCGIVLGVVTGDLAVSTMNSFTTAFMRRLDWRACAAGAVGSTVIMTVMSLISLRGISKFKLTDINK